MHNVSKLKRADLLSTTGAAVAGAGLALLFQDYLVSYAAWLLVAGIVAHGMAMVLKRRLEHHGPTDRLVWVEVAYWLCWIVLAGLLALVLVRAG